MSLLVDDRVQRDGGLARAAVADDQFALAAPDGDHRVDGLDAGLQRLFDRLALDDARRAGFQQAELGGGDRAFVVNRLAQRVDDAPDQRLADRDLDDLAGALDGVAFFDAGLGAQKHRADIVFFQVQRHALHAAGELQQFADHGVLQAVDARDAVADLQDGADADFFDFGLDRLPVPVREWM